MEKILFTSESVSEGHPDKVSDQISDAVLDAALKGDENSRVACEVLCTNNHVIIAGEITSKTKINYDQIVRDVLRRVGYDRDELGTNADNVNIINLVSEQSPDISMGVTSEKKETIGAGDQGIMFGYATNESEGYMPLAISLAHKLVRIATKLRKEGAFKGSRPDMKSQVTIDYSDKDNIKIDTILMSCSHDPDVDLDVFKQYIHDEIMVNVASSFGLNTDFKYYIGG